MTIAPQATGFPSPAHDFASTGIDLNRTLIAHPSSTFFVRIDESPKHLKFIESGDVMVVDTSIIPKKGELVIAETIDGLSLECFSEQNLWGVVTYLIRPIR